MQIDNNFSMEKEPFSYTLKWKGEPYIDEKTKKTVLPERDWYYPTIEACLVAYISRKIETENRTAENILEQISEIKEIIKDSLKKVKENE